jgi:hypothetical protein
VLLSAFLAILGMGLAIFQATYARQANRVIGFWREYAKLIEAKSKIKFDSLQYGFLESGKVDTEFGQINKKDKSQKTLYDLFKWEDHAFTKSTIVLGIIFPLGLALFWNLGFVLILYDLRSTFIQHLTLSVWANHLLVGVTCLAPFGLLLGLTYWALGRNLAMPVAVLPTE